MKIAYKKTGRESSHIYLSQILSGLLDDDL